MPKRKTKQRHLLRRDRRTSRLKKSEAVDRRPCLLLELFAPLLKLVRHFLNANGVASMARTCRKMSKPFKLDADVGIQTLSLKSDKLDRATSPLLGLLCSSNIRTLTSVDIALKRHTNLFPKGICQAVSVLGSRLLCFRLYYVCCDEVFEGISVQGMFARDLDDLLCATPNITELDLRHIPITRIRMYGDRKFPPSLAELRIIRLSGIESDSVDAPLLLNNTPRLAHIELDCCGCKMNKSAKGLLGATHRSDVRTLRAQELPSVVLFTLSRLIEIPRLEELQCEKLGRPYEGIVPLLRTLSCPLHVLNYFSDNFIAPSLVTLRILGIFGMKSDSTLAANWKTVVQCKNKLPTITTLQITPPRVPARKIELLKELAAGAGLHVTILVSPH
jgi:hypothetical protein